VYFFITLIAVILIISINVTVESLIEVGRGFTRILEVFSLFNASQDFDNSVVSYRDQVYSLALNGIADKPWFGYGPYFATRIVVPAHNLFLDMLLQFGVILGTLLGCIFISLILHVYFVKRNRFLVLLSTPTLVYLFFSGSFLMSFEFWFFITLFICVSRGVSFEKT